MPWKQSFISYKCRIHTQTLFPDQVSNSAALNSFLPDCCCHTFTCLCTGSALPVKNWAIFYGNWYMLWKRILQPAVSSAFNIQNCCTVLPPLHRRSAKCWSLWNNYLLKDTYTTMTAFKSYKLPAMEYDTVAHWIVFHVLQLQSQAEKCSDSTKCNRWENTQCPFTHFHLKDYYFHRCTHITQCQIEESLLGRLKLILLDPQFTRWFVYWVGVKPSLRFIFTQIQ